MLPFVVVVDVVTAVVFCRLLLLPFNTLSSSFVDLCFPAAVVVVVVVVVGSFLLSIPVVAAILSFGPLIDALWLLGVLCSSPSIGCIVYQPSRNDQISQPNQDKRRQQIQKRPSSVFVSIFLPEVFSEWIA